MVPFSVLQSIGQCDLSSSSTSTTSTASLTHGIADRAEHDGCEEQENLNP